MEPEIGAAGDVKCQLVVLHISAPDKDLRAAVGQKTQRLSRRGLFLALSLRLFLDISGVYQLAADIGKIAVAPGAGQLVEHALQIQLLLACHGDQLRKHPVGSFRFIIELIIVSRVLLRRFALVKRHGNGRAVRLMVILRFKRAHTALQPVHICRDEIAPAAIFLTLLCFQKFLLACRDLAHEAVVRRFRRACKIGAAAAQIFLLILFPVKGVQKLAERRKLRQFGAAAVLIYRLERKVPRHAVNGDHDRRKVSGIDTCAQRVKRTCKTFPSAERQFPAQKR